MIAKTAGLSGHPWSTPESAFTSHAKPSSSQKVCRVVMAYQGPRTLDNIGISAAKVFRISFLDIVLNALTASKLRIVASGRRWARTLKAF